MNVNAVAPVASAAKPAATPQAKFGSSISGRQLRSAVALPSARRNATTTVRAAVATDKASPILIDGQVAHSATEAMIECMTSMGTDGWADRELMPMLADTTKCWQPQDYLPNPESDTFLDEVRELRERTKNISDDHLVSLVGDMITEEALPTYMTMLNTLDGVRDETGAQPSPWGIWTRAWTAEENRHGDLMNKYLWLTGRVDMKRVEVTIQNLIGSGMDPKTENNPYMGFIYTSFQERATKISHGNTGRHALEQGDKSLAQICGIIAADEGRHEIAYQRIVQELFNRDPSNTMLCFADMMKKQIVMPAHLMDDGVHMGRTGNALFEDFSSIAESTGTYTAGDYASIIDHLVKKWDINNVGGLSEEGIKAQEYVCKLAPRIRKLGERAAARKAKGGTKPVEFSWIFDRPVDILK